MDQDSQWAELVKAFESCMQLEECGAPMGSALQRLQDASTALTTHVGHVQWKKHEAVRRYLKSCGFD